MQFNEEYYNNVIENNGYNPMDFSPMDFWFKGISPEIMKVKWLCHSGIQQFREYDSTIITTGIGLSGTPHMGTLSQILRIIFLQKYGFNVQMVLGDLDSYNARNQDFEVVEKRADIYKRFIKELGFDEKKGILRKQYDCELITRTSVIVAKYLSDQDFYDTEEDLSELYIKENIYEGITFPVKQAILLMISDFLHLGMYDNYKNVIVMLGLEEHKYVLLARKALQRMELDFGLCGMYSRIIKGLNGYPKMSKSIKLSSISVDLSREEILVKILGEKDDYSCPEDSVIYQLISSVSYYSVDELLEIRKHCEKKDKLWQEMKLEYANELCKLCEIWKEVTI